MYIISLLAYLISLLAWHLVEARHQSRTECHASSCSPGRFASRPLAIMPFSFIHDSKHILIRPSWCPNLGCKTGTPPAKVRACRCLQTRVSFSNPRHAKGKSLSRIVRAWSGSLWAKGHLSVNTVFKVAHQT